MKTEEEKAAARAALFDILDKAPSLLMECIRLAYKAEETGLVDVMAFWTAQAKSLHDFIDSQMRGESFRDFLDGQIEKGSNSQ